MEGQYPTKESIMGTKQRYVRGDGTVTWFIVDEETIKYISWCECCETYGVTRSHRLCEIDKMEEECPCRYCQSGWQEFEKECPLKVESMTSDTHNDVIVSMMERQQRLEDKITKLEEILLNQFWNYFCGCQGEEE